jgi:hypothetical protein
VCDIFGEPNEGNRFIEISSFDDKPSGSPYPGGILPGIAVSGQTNSSASGYNRTASNDIAVRRANWSLMAS